MTAYVRRSRGLPAPTRPDPGKCEVCGQASGKKALSLDHCHVTNKFRGWLCNNCNAGIGLLGDAVEDLEAALRYLTKATRSVTLKEYLVTKRET